MLYCIVSCIHTLITQYNTVTQPVKAGLCYLKHFMNFYIDKYTQVINDCKTPIDYQKAYTRIVNNICSIILGRGFNQDIDEYLNENSTKKEFFEWWNGMKYDLHIKAYAKPLQLPAQ